MAVYICSKCLFSFERSGKVDSCPRCEDINVRFAAEEEKAEYLRARKETRGDGKNKKTD